jgi:DNA-binding GntR family transcriptional regulator
MAGAPEITEHLDLPEGSKVIKLTRLRYAKGSFGDGPIVLTTSYYPMKFSFLQNYDFSTISVHKALAEHGMARKFTEKHINVAILDPRSCRLMCVENGSPALSIVSYTRDTDNELMEYCESLYPADRNEFILKIRL